MHPVILTLSVVDNITKRKIIQFNETRKSCIRFIDQFESKNLLRNFLVASGRRNFEADAKVQ